MTYESVRTRALQEAMLKLASRSRDAKRQRRIAERQAAGTYTAPGGSTPAAPSVEVPVRTAPPAVEVPIHAPAVPAVPAVPVEPAHTTPAPQGNTVHPAPTTTSTPPVTTTPTSPAAPAKAPGFWGTPGWKRNLAIGGIGAGALALGAGAYHMLSNNKRDDRR